MRKKGPKRRNRVKNAQLVSSDYSFYISMGKGVQRLSCLDGLLDCVFLGASSATRMKNRIYKAHFVKENEQNSIKAY